MVHIDSVTLQSMIDQQVKLVGKTQRFVDNLTNDDQTNCVQLAAAIHELEILIQIKKIYDTLVTRFVTKVMVKFTITFLVLLHYTEYKTPHQKQNTENQTQNTNQTQTKHKTQHGTKQNTAKHPGMID